MAVDLTKLTEVNDVIFHTVMFDTTLPAWHNKDKQGKHIVYHPPAIVTEVHKSYLIVFCPFHNKRIRVNRSQVDLIDPGYDDTRKAAEIPAIRPYSPIILLNKKIITL